MKSIVFLIIYLVVFTSCANVKDSKEHSEEIQSDKTTELVTHEAEKVTEVPQSDQLKDRIPVPIGYRRSTHKAKSFGTYLRGLTLKPEGSIVKYYDGSLKSNHGIYVGVVDLPIGNEDLHQCADAIMRLRAEYFWKNQQYDKIHFNFTNGHKVEYSEWMKGKRMQVIGNKTQWVPKEEPSNTYDDFWQYLELIFMYAGTASLEKEMQAINLSEARIGDVLIKGGFPGHAVIIVDEAVHETSGQKVFLLAQSFMPAQETHILTNPMDNSLSPWYHLDQEQIFTAQWEFSSNDLKRFVE